MNARSRAVVVLLSAVLCVGLGPLRASADTMGVGTFTGTANVGKWFSTPCDKNGDADVDGKGLYLPGTQTVEGVTKGDDTRPEEGVWQISVPNGVIAAGVTQSGAIFGDFAFALCGHLSATVDPDRSRRNTAGAVGASCGASKGHHGQGRAFLYGKDVEMLKLFNIGWKTTAGATIPIYGNYQEYLSDWSDPKTAAKKDKFGTVFGEIQAQGGLGCLGVRQPGGFNHGNGAQTFTVAGLVELINGVTLTKKEDADLLSPVGGPKYCKRQGPQLPENPGEKKPTDKQGSNACTVRQGGDKR